MSAYGSKQTYKGKWDEEEYARKGRERQQQEYEKRQRRGREEIKEDAVEASARSERLNIYEGLNQVTLVPAGASTGKRGRGAGFYCQVCDLTFKDSLDYTDHLNSKQHLYASGQKETVRRATLEEVRERLEYLRKIKKDKVSEFNIRERVEKMRASEEKKRQERRDKKREKRRVETEKEKETQGDDEMKKMMGFSAFRGNARWVAEGLLHSTL